MTASTPNAMGETMLITFVSETLRKVENTTPMIAMKVITPAVTMSPRMIDPPPPVHLRKPLR